MARGRNVSTTTPAAAHPAERRPRNGRGIPVEAARAEGDRQLTMLIEAVARADAQALERLYAETLGRVFGLALRIVRRREAAEEVAVDVYLQVWRTAATFDALRGGPVTWLLTICRSRALDHLRREEPAVPHPDPEVLAPVDGRGDDPQDLLAACQGNARLLRALGSLSALQRQLIALAFFRGLTHREIAAHARLPLGSVKTYIRRALAQLRADLGTMH